MPSIRYPDLDEFWPAVRARNFVKLLGFKPSKYEENMVILAARAGVHVKQMQYVNPLTFAERSWIHPRARTLIEQSVYIKLDLIRQSTYHPSVSWAYALRDPIPPYVETTA
jgi:hypothetical protein